MNGPVDASSNVVADQVKQAHLDAVQSGAVNEFVTGQQTNYVTFQDKFELLRFNKQSNAQEKIQIFQLRTPDPLHLTDPALLLTIGITRAAISSNQGALTLQVTDGTLVDNIIKRVAMRFGTTQDQRNKSDPIEILFKVGKLFRLSKEGYQQDHYDKYGAVKEVIFPEQSANESHTIYFNFCIPLWMVDSSGLIGTYKVYPANNLIYMELEFERDLGNIFDHTAAQLSGVTYGISEAEIFVRTTTVNSSLKAGDVAIVEGLLSQLEQTTGQQIDPRALSDAQTMADIIKSADKNSLNASSFISLLSTPTHFYGTNEIPCTTFNLPATFPPTSQTLSAEIIIQQQMVLPKSLIFYLRAYDKDNHRLPLAPRDPARNPVLSFNLKIDGRQLSQFDQSNIAFQNYMLKHAVGRQHIGLYYADDPTKGEIMPAIYGMVCGAAGNVDYETGVKTANLSLQIQYNPLYTTTAAAHSARPIARIDCMVARIYTQQINSDTNGQVVFQRTTV